MYKIQYTERNNKKANEYETRSLLYLLSMRDDSDEISLFFVDCINDLTGSNDDCTKLWDTQAKGVSSLNPTKIGVALITLFENYISELEFTNHILLIPKLNEGYLKNENLLSFTFENFIEAKKAFVINGIKDEYKKRNGNSISQQIIEKVEKFIMKVTFVVGVEKENYIKEIAHFKNKDSHSTAFYQKIFDEIRDKQSALKNICIEGIEISHPLELLSLNKFLRGNEIKLMVLNRFVGTELFKGSAIPNSYFDEVKTLDNQDRLDLIQDNNSKISRTFFNKNNKKYFWLLLENIMLTIAKNKTSESRTIYEKLDVNLINANYTMDEQSTIFFISLIKDGINDAN
jgi:hypothetical protein